MKLFSRRRSPFSEAPERKTPLRNHRTTKRHRLVKQRCLLVTESLEDRSLLATIHPADDALLLVSEDQYDPGSILVRFRDDVAGPAPAAAGRPHWTPPDVRQVRLAQGVDVETALAAWRADPRVLYAEPNYVIQIAATPNDPDYDSLWGLHNTGQTGGLADADIDASQAWDITTGNSATVVAVIDTGIDYTHEDLAANIWVNPGEIPGDGLDNDGNGYVDDVHGYDFANNDGDPMDDNNHGTHVAGTIGGVGDNGVGVTGVNWDVQMMALKFLDESGSGSIADAIDAINYAVANGANISNNSWGFGGGFSQGLYDSIAAARDADHIFLAAAGNGNFLGIGQNNDNTPFWPSSFDLDNIISVAAVDHNDQRATFSNFGATSVDLAAPGVSILSTTIDDTYSHFSGTSMATPHVAGVTALVRGLHPSWNYEQVINRILVTAEPISSMQGITVTGGRLNAFEAVTPDTTGPQVIAADPTGATSTLINSLRISFSESIAADSFTVGDIVSFTGPSGAIAATDVQPVPGTLGRDFEITFPTQSELGDYTLTIGPDILDPAGNAMDQDADGTPGELLEDTFTTGFTLLPFVGKFDFGTSTSPVQPGYSQVLPTTNYSAAVKYGWQAGSPIGVNRSAASALERDLNYGPDLTFAVDVPSGAYDVTLTIGDHGPYAHEQMSVLLEGSPVDNVSTAAGEVLTRLYSEVHVSDGQLTVHLVDQGGADPNVVINGLEVIWAGPDSLAPQVIAAVPSGDVSGGVDRVSLTFSEPIDASSFTLADVLQLTGPAGAIVPTAVQSVGATQFDVLFAEQTALGDYLLTIGSDIVDGAGNLLDQDGDGTGGETPDDHFTANFSITPFEARFDFGLSTSPVQPDFTPITPANSAYSSSVGYGYLAGSPIGVNRNAGTALDRDLHYAPELIFAVDAPNGIYQVTLTTGDRGAYAHEQMAVYLEEIHLDTVSTIGGQIQSLVYSAITVSDGQLTLRMTDLGGADPNVVLNGLEMVWLGPDNVGPQVLAASPTGEVAPPVDRITLTFSEAIQSGSFTTADVVELSGPGGAIVPLAVNQLSNAQFEVVFAEQIAEGQYSLTIGPEIYDLAGQALDQDGDGVAGEPVEDRFTVNFTISAFIAQFDFGTANSPAAPGYTKITPASAYSAALGYGWQGSGGGSVDRGAGDPVARDLVYASNLTFVVDAPSGAYDITLTTGDLGPYAHQQMGVYVEGSQVDTVSTAASEVVTRTYSGVHVSDGQLTLFMTDLGGADPNVVINGLEIAWIGPDSTAPRIIAASPTGEVLGLVDRVALTFSKPIDQTSFAIADVVEFTGPQGAIAATAVNRISDVRYEVVFPQQSDIGDYTLTIGPQIADLTGNLLDQDGDGTSGESPDDRFTTNFTIAPFVAQFDFGQANSPLEPGYTAITPSTSYSASLGYGWQAGAPSAVDRGAGSALSRDLNYGADLTLGVDVPDGVYEVTLTTGDHGPYLHDLMNVHLEDVAVETITTAPGEVATLVYSGVTVSDGQLTVRMVDLGGTDANVVINGLEAAWIAPVTAGPRVIAANPQGEINDPVDRITLTFGKPIQPGTFTAADVAQLAGPQGAIAVTAVNQLSETQFEVVFAEQSALGNYTITVGPDIQDLAGAAMDQDGDGTSGELLDDQFTTGFMIAPLTVQFDFGTTSSPVETGHVQITPTSGYSATMGYGYLAGAINSVDRASGTAMERDLNYAADLTFAVDVPDGVYTVTLITGDFGPYAHDQMAVYLEGSQVDTVSTAPGQVLTRTYTDTTVSDGQLTLRMLDLGGGDVNVVINGLELVRTGPLAAIAHGGRPAFSGPSRSPGESSRDEHRGLRPAQVGDAAEHPRAPRAERVLDWLFGQGFSSDPGIGGSGEEHSECSAEINLHEWLDEDLIGELAAPR